MATPRMRQLGNFASQMPTANRQVASGLEQARQAQLQAQVGGMTRAGQQLGIRAAQQLGAQQAGVAGQQALQAAEQAQRQTQATAQLAQGEEAMSRQQILADRAVALDRRKRDLENQLGALGRDLKNQLFDQQMVFAQDELGRTLFQERQLLDWKLVNAKSDEEFATYEQRTRQLSSRRMKMLQVSLERIKQSLAQGFTAEQQKLDQQQRERLVLAKRALEEKIRREKARSANRAAIFQTVGGIVGGVVGGIYGGPMGATAGYSVGSGLGSVAAGATE